MPPLWRAGWVEWNLPTRCRSGITALRTCVVSKSFLLVIHEGRCQRPRSVPFRANTVRSTVGAGDTFIAGMLYGLICHTGTDDWGQEAKLGYAVELATKKVQREGFAGLTGA